jgi:hypothetical protein
MHPTDTAARFAASSRPWPARMVPVSSIRIGLVQTRWMLFIKRAILHSGCCLGSPGNGFKSPIARQTILSVRPRGWRFSALAEIADLACHLKLCVLVHSLRAPISSLNPGEAPRTRGLWGNFLCVAICRLSLFVEN